MDCTHLHASTTQCMWNAADALISSQNRLGMEPRTGDCVISVINEGKIACTIGIRAVRW